MITETIQERTLEFKPKASFASVGIQSEITIGEVAGMGAIRKVAGQELSFDERDMMVDAMRQYRSHLRDNGIAVPMSFSLKTTDQGIEMVDQLVKGDDLDVLIKGGKGKGEWMEVVETLCDLNDGGTKSKVMIDAKPANWIVGNKTYFIDFFPPTLRDANGELHPFIPRLYKRSKSLFNFNYGDTRGQITKLLAGARLTYPERYAELAGVTLGVVKDRIPHLADYIEQEVMCEFPDMNLFYRDQVAGERRLGQLL